jgi:hypothetical protein
LFGAQELQAQIVGLKKSGPWDMGCAANQALADLHTCHFYEEPLVLVIFSIHGSANRKYLGANNALDEIPYLF